MKGFTIICNKCGLHYTYERFVINKDSENLMSDEMNIGTYKNKNGHMHGIECNCGYAVEEPCVRQHMLNEMIAEK